jgi:2-iminobutanoate/2-iminopropanoate deaminase
MLQIQCFKNLVAVLHAGGSDVEHVVKTSVFLKDLSTFSEMNEVFGSVRFWRSKVCSV